ncbi:MAG: hypothetical protein GEU73_03945 [Chloroflexi bacterium]|nr:hypothetical protein [Chloroflexota bacterium]
MALFNRVVVSLLFLALLALAVTLISVPSLVFGAGEILLATLRGLPPASVEAGAAALALPVGIGLLWELWPRPSRVFEASAEGTTVVYPAQTVARVVQQELGGLEGILETKAAANGSRHKVGLNISMIAAPGQDPQQVAAWAATHVREKVERGLGLSLRRLRLSIQLSQTDRPTAVSQARHAETDGPSVTIAR